MLVLSRKCSQSVRIGEEIRITIVRVDRGRVRIGIEAPGHVAVWRDELDPGMALGSSSGGCGLLAAAEA